MRILLPHQAEKQFNQFTLPIRNSKNEPQNQFEPVAWRTEPEKPQFDSIREPLSPANAMYSKIVNRKQTSREPKSEMLESDGQTDL